MKILAIETSCDETAAAVVENGRKVLANVIASQIDLHAKTGGVVPEVAAREHVLKMIPVLEECMSEAGCDWDDIEALAITRGPGLISSLIIGTETASVISYVKAKPLIPVQHIVGHIYSNWLGDGQEPRFPILILTVSGGHNELILMKDHHKFEVLGETRDDAAGEAFDKVARILGLGYPGGPAIAKMALNGDGGRFKLPRSFLEKGSLDFSFSGLKTAVLNEVKKNERKVDEQFKADLAASFQEAVVEVLSEKLIVALKKFPKVREVHLAGGVSANKRLREMIAEKLKKFNEERLIIGENAERRKALSNVIFRHPKSFDYCTDNAAMIAAAGYYLYKSAPKKFKRKTNIIPTTSFEIW
ncbi:tRNA (adenosine(37)-N6)-threonylcarbamoyltransferase complex transferase subunit TsaD [Candidatus Peregrinibacteria bacterium]|nr:tRNA (adenosine(37)-N6)-threonylcarbamoyltransferase complex transferase subunit TsaD [Candidatus Peregrinibacteria bacterium]